MDQFTIYGIAINPEGRIGILANVRQRVGKDQPTRSVSDTWTGETFSNTRDGEGKALKRILEMNNETGRQLQARAG